MQHKITEELHEVHSKEVDLLLERFYDGNLLDRLSRRDRFEHYYARFLATEKTLVRDNIIDRIPQGKVLNIGCGDNGIERSLFPTPAYTIFGVDINAESLITLQRKKLYNGLYNASIGSLPFADETFDIIYLRLVLHHLMYPEQILDEGLEECFRVLKIAGLLALVEPNSWHPIGAMMNVAHMFGIDMYIHGNDDDVALSPMKLRRTLSEYGTEISTHVISYNWRRLPIYCQMSVDTFQSALKGVSCRWPYFGHTLMMVARKR